MRNSENRALKKKSCTRNAKNYTIVTILICYSRYTITNTWRGADVKQKI